MYILRHMVSQSLNNPCSWRPSHASMYTRKYAQVYKHRSRTQETIWTSLPPAPYLYIKIKIKINHCHGFSNKVWARVNTTAHTPTSVSEGVGPWDLCRESVRFATGGFMLNLGFCLPSTWFMPWDFGFPVLVLQSLAFRIPESAFTVPAELNHYTEWRR